MQEPMIPPPAMTIRSMRDAPSVCRAGLIPCLHTAWKPRSVAVDETDDGVGATLAFDLEADLVAGAEALQRRRIADMEDARAAFEEHRRDRSVFQRYAASGPIDRDDA